jgi:hypothetical protein
MNNNKFNELMDNKYYLKKFREINKDEIKWLEKESEYEKYISIKNLNNI